MNAYGFLKLSSGCIILLAITCEGSCEIFDGELLVLL